MSTFDTGHHRAVRPGSWFGVFGARVTVMLPPSEKARVAALWELVDDGAGFDEVLDALIATGLRELPGFVLVSDLDGTTKVVLRGDATATFVSAGETVALDGSSASTWVERSLPEVTSMELVLDSETDGDGPVLTVLDGLVRASRVTVPAESATSHESSGGVHAAGATGAAIGAESSDGLPGGEPELDVAWQDTVAMADPTADDDASTDQARGDADQESSQEQPVAPAFSFDKPDAPAEEQPDPWAQPEQPGQQYGDQYSDQPPAAPAFGQPAPEESIPTQAPGAPAWQPGFGDAPPPPPWGEPESPGSWQPEGAPESPAGDPASDNPWHDPSADPQWHPGGAPSGGDADHDGQTRVGDYDPAEFARQPSGIPGQPQAPSVTAEPVARLSLSSGDVVDVDRVVIIGRAPEARRFTSTEQPRLITVPSPNQEISSTHLEIRPGSGVDHGTAVVTDLGSTNGTVLLQPGLPPEELNPGIAVQLNPGAVIDLGDGLTIQVSQP